MKLESNDLASTATAAIGSNVVGRCETKNETGRTTCKIAKPLNAADDKLTLLGPQSIVIRFGASSTDPIEVILLEEGSPARFLLSVFAGAFVCLCFAVDLLLRRRPESRLSPEYVAFGAWILALLGVYGIAILVRVLLPNPRLPDLHESSVLGLLLAAIPLALKAELADGAQPFATGASHPRVTMWRATATLASGYLVYTARMAGDDFGFVAAPNLPGIFMFLQAVIVVLHAAPYFVPMTLRVKQIGLEFEVHDFEGKCAQDLVVSYSTDRTSGSYMELHAHSVQSRLRYLLPPAEGASDEVHIVAFRPSTGRYASFALRRPAKQAQDPAVPFPGPEPTNSPATASVKPAASAGVPGTPGLRV